MSFGIYVAVLAVVDNITLTVGKREFMDGQQPKYLSISLFNTSQENFATLWFPGFFDYLSSGHHVVLHPFPKTTCSLKALFGFSSVLCGMLILAMKFDRFYGIVRPHMAASVNTVKRAKISCVCIISSENLILFDVRLCLFMSPMYSNIRQPQCCASSFIVYFCTFATQK